jgi:hypothetical protein
MLYPALDERNITAQKLKNFKEEHKRKFGKFPKTKLSIKKEDGKKFFLFSIKTKYSVFEFKGKDIYEHMAVSIALQKAESKQKRIRTRVRKMTFVKNFFLKRKTA